MKLKGISFSISIQIKVASMYRVLLG